MIKKTKKHIGPIIGSLIVLIAIIMAGIYSFASHTNNGETVSPYMSASPNDGSATMTSSSDDIQSLKSDLNKSIK